MKSRRESRVICAQLCEWKPLRAAGYLLVYAPVQREVDIYPLLHAPELRGQRIVFPRVCGQRLELYQTDNYREELAPGSCGVMEPGQDQANRVEPEQIDVVLIPAIVFDRRGFRIGYGGGYYDRLLARRRGWKTVGVGYDWQVVDSLPTEPHDRRLDYLCTGQGMVSCRQGV